MDKLNATVILSVYIVKDNNIDVADESENCVKK